MKPSENSNMNDVRPYPITPAIPKVTPRILKRFDIGICLKQVISDGFATLSNESINNCNIVSNIKLSVTIIRNFK